MRYVPVLRWGCPLTLSSTTPEVQKALRVADHT